MAKLLFEDFLENKDTYHAVEQMWKEFFDAFAEKHGFSYRPYLKTTYINGVPFYNGNPIFTAFNEAINRAIRIIQINKEEAGDLHISGWVDTFELEEDQPPIHELVISLVLSEEAKAIAEQFIHAWLVEQVDEESMDRLVEARMILAE